MLTMTNLVLRGMLVHMLLFSGRCSFMWHVTTVKQFRAESRRSRIFRLGMLEYKMHVFSEVPCQPIRA